MQYYRLWIYSCNVVLGLTSAIFIIFAAFVVADVRLSLLDGVELYHPTFIFAYGALIVQCGVVQTIGCLGAQRLSHKLLSLYWTLLLLLTLGDIGIGLYWVFHLEKVKINLRPYLNKEFIEKYSTDETFTLRWNKIQSQERCCGVDGPFDFEKFPPTHQQHHSNQAAFSSNPRVIVDVETGILSLPESCCTLLYVPTSVSSSSSSGTGLDKTHRVSDHSLEEERPQFSDQSSDTPVSSSNDHHHFHYNSIHFPGGGGRHGRTVMNLPHNSDEPRSFQFNESDDDTGEDSRSQESNPQQKFVVPDEENHDQNRGMIQSSDDDAHRSNFLVHTRDIKTYEPSSHSHKIRHELHRKSQSPSVIDAKLLTRNSYVVEERNRNSSVDRNWNSPKSSRGSNSFRSRSSHDKNDTQFKSNKSLREAIIRKLLGAREEGEDAEKIVVPEEEKHYNQNHNKTNKLFPSISFHVQRRQRRETRALLVTQVPAVGATATTHRRRVCQGQPVGLNHHNSYKKDLLDQRKTTKDKREDGEKATISSSPFSPNAKDRRAAWAYKNHHKRGRNSSSAATASSVKSGGGRGRTSHHQSDATLALSTLTMGLPAARSMEQDEVTSVTIAEKMRTDEIEKTLRKEEDEESLLALRKSQRIMTRSADVDAPLQSSKLTSFASSREPTLPKGKERPRRQPRQKRNVTNQLKVYMNSGAVSSVPATLKLSDPFGIAQNSAFISYNNKKKRSVAETETEKESKRFFEPYFFPLSSSSALSSSSSTSYLEVLSPQAAIVSPSTSPYDQSNENGESGSFYNNGNSSNGSVSGTQKRLYVYGVGCGVKLIEWVDHVSGILFILGFCIIGFAKTCFLVILRTEIREMIEKIHMIEPEEVMSPSRKESRFLHVSHPLLQNPHRASTVSAQGIVLPTIKSPDLPPPTSYVPPPTVVGAYNRPNRHYLRRASNIVGGDRSRSHSNETVHMTLLMANSPEPGGREKGRSNPNLSSSAGGSGSCGTITNLEERDAVSGLSITVPGSSASATTSSAAMGAARYLRRSSTCSSSANPAGYPFAYGFDAEPRAGPSSRFYQYFEPLYQPTHLYQQHHHHHYMRNRSHARNMSCGAILPLTSYRTNSAAAAASAALSSSYRGGRNFSNTTTTTQTSNLTSSGGCSFSSTSKDENEMIISVSLEHIAPSDRDEEMKTPVVVEEKEEEGGEEEEEEEERKEQEKKDWAAATACLDVEGKENVKSALDGDIDESCVGTKLQTFTHTETAEVENSSGNVNDESGSGVGERELQRRNGNNNVDVANSLPMSYIGTAV